MQTNQEPKTPAPEYRPPVRTSRYDFNSLTLKIALTALAALVLLIPGSMISGLIDERQELAQESQHEVAQMWSGEQHITGPVLTIPYFETVTDSGTKKTTTVEGLLTLLPERLVIDGDATCQSLRRGFYDAIVYNAELTLSGHFVRPDRLLKHAGNDIRLQTQRAALALGLGDLRGIEERIEIVWSGHAYPTSTLTGSTCFRTGVGAAVDLSDWLSAPDGTTPFTVKLRIKGSQGLFFAPVGDQTEVHLRSDCPTPSFSGIFLPTSRNITKEGFTADWKVVSQNRSYNQIFTGDCSDSISESEFGVGLLIPVTQYQQATRSIKYAILVVLLTFAGVLFGEIAHRRKLHPLQYLLVGLALILFYALLVSLSEQLGFGTAYLIAAVMTTLLIAVYIRAATGMVRLGVFIGGLLALLYTYIYVLLQMENYALLAGSVGLFVILAVVMHYSLKFKPRV